MTKPAIRALVTEALAMCSGDLDDWFLSEGDALLGHAHGSVQMALKRFDEPTTRAITREVIRMAYERGKAARP